MEGKSFAVQAKPPKLYFAKPPEDDGAKGMKGTRELGRSGRRWNFRRASWGALVGWRKFIRGIAEGKGVGDVSVLFLVSFSLSRRRVSALHRDSHSLRIVLFRRKLNGTFADPPCPCCRVWSILMKRSRDIKWFRRLPGAQKMGQGKAISDGLPSMPGVAGIPSRRNGRCL